MHRLKKKRTRYARELLRMDQSKFRNMDAKASCVGRKNNLIANNNQSKTKKTNTILWNIQGLRFVLSGISRGKLEK